MTNPSVAQVETDDAVGPAATTAITPSRQLFADHLSPILDHPQEVSPPSPMAQASADAAMRLEMAQLRAELGLIRTQMGKKAQAVESEDEAAEQDAEEAAKFYKEEFRKLRIQVGEQDKAIAELYSSARKSSIYFRPSRMCVSLSRLQLDKAKEMEAADQIQCCKAKEMHGASGRRHSHQGCQSPRPRSCRKRMVSMTSTTATIRRKIGVESGTIKNGEADTMMMRVTEAPGATLTRKTSSNQRPMAATYQSGWHGKAPSYAT